MPTITHEQERSAPQKKYDEKVLERVLRSLKWLEETHGPGWEDKIDLATLDLSDGAHCVLGQIYREEAKREDPDANGFGYAMDHLSIGSDSCAARGFIRDWSNGILYENLTACWKDVLTPKINPGS